MVYPFIPADKSCGIAPNGLVSGTFFTIFSKFFYFFAIFRTWGRVIKYLINYFFCIAPRHIHIFLFIFFRYSLDLIHCCMLFNITFIAFYTYLFGNKSTVCVFLTALCLRFVWCLICRIFKIFIDCNKMDFHPFTKIC